MEGHKYRQSEFGKWKRCRRAHHWQYTEGLYLTSPEGQLPTPNKSDIGTYAHVGFAALHKGETLDSALMLVAAEHEHRFAGETTDEWDKTVEYALSSVRHYNDWLEEGHTTGQKILGVEMPWEAELDSNSYRFRWVYGTTDLVVDDPLTGVVVVDMKTVGSQTQTPEEVDFQLRTYAWAYWQETGIVPARAEHRMVKRVLHGGTAKPPFVSTHGIHINEGILTMHHLHMAVMATEIDWARESEVQDQYLYPNPHKDCKWDCSYRDICPLVDDGGDVESVVQLSYVRTSDEQ